MNNISNAWIKIGKGLKYFIYKVWRRTWIPNDLDYLWTIVDLMEVEVGSVSKRELEQTRVKFDLPLERDLYFELVNAQTFFQGLNKGEYY